MKIVISEDIYYGNKLFGLLGETKTVPGRKISKEILKDADALMVRSATQVNEELLSGTSVKFVGTATSGTDHIDINWLKNSGIKFSAALGCNSIAVAEYVISAILKLAERNNFDLKDRKVGIVGLGNIGKYLQKCFKLLEISTLICDPPRADRGEKGDFLNLNELVSLTNIITFHTPLSMDGPYKTFHLADETIINRLNPGSILINTCRGPVVDNAALLSRLKTAQDLSVVLDVWESEPNISTDLLKIIDIGTAHIAGYTLEGRIRGTIQLFEDYSNFIGIPQQISINTMLPIPKFDSITVHGSLDNLTLKNLVHLIYDLRRDDLLLRKVSEIPGGFDKLRRNYHDRREWSSLNVICSNFKTAKLLSKVGFKTIYFQSF